MACPQRASCYPEAMTEQAMDAAVARLERAVERLDNAVRTREKADGGLKDAHAALEKRHAVLRSRVQETIARLDTLIELGPAA